MHDEPKHQHAWLPLHKPPTHGKDLALLLMKGRSLIMARVARAGGPAAYLSMSLLPSLKVDGAYMLLNPSLNGPRFLLQFARPGESAKELG